MDKHALRHREPLACARASPSLTTWSTCNGSRSMRTGFASSGRVSMSPRSTKPRSSSGASSGYGRCPANRLQRCGGDRCSAIAEAVSRAAVRLTSLRVKAYRVLAPVHGGLGLADRPPQVKDPPDLAEEVLEAPRAAFLGSGCCARLAAESFQYEQRRLSCRSRVLSDPIIVAPSDASRFGTMELDVTWLGVVPATFGLAIGAAGIGSPSGH